MEILIQTLIQAGLLTETQAEVVRHDIEIHPGMSLGEILSLRGWIAEETIDFFELLWEMRHTQPERRNIGQYLLEAHLITQAQLDEILTIQTSDVWGCNLRFGEIAVLKGYIKQATIHFFIEHLFPDQLSATTKNPFARSQGTQEKTPKTNPAKKQIIAKAKVTSPPSTGTNKREQPRKKLLDRLADKRKKSRSTAAQQKQVLPDEAFSTSFDLIDAEDFDPGQL